MLGVGSRLNGGSRFCMYVCGSVCLCVREVWVCAALEISFRLNAELFIAFASRKIKGRRLWQSGKIHTHTQIRISAHTRYISQHLPMASHHKQQDNRSHSKNGVYADIVSLVRWHIHEQSVVYLMWPMRRQSHKFIRSHASEPVVLRFTWNRPNKCQCAQCGQTDKFQANVPSALFPLIFFYIVFVQALFHKWMHSVQFYNWLWPRTTSPVRISPCIQASEFLLKLHLCHFRETHSKWRDRWLCSKKI